MQNIKHAVAISHLFGHDLSNSTKPAASESQTSPLALPLLFFLAAEHCKVLGALPWDRENLPPPRLCPPGAALEPAETLLSLLAGFAFFSDKEGSRAQFVRHFTEQVREVSLRRNDLREGMKCIGRVSPKGPRRGRMWPEVMWQTCWQTSGKKSRW